MKTMSAAFHIAYMLLLITAFASRSIALTAVYLAVCLVYVLRNLRSLRAASVRDLRLLVLMLAGPSSLLVVSIMRLGLPALFHMLVAASAAIAAYAATRDSRAYWQASKWGLFVVQGVVLGYLATTGLADFPLENLIPDSSSNGITSYILVLQINYCAASYALFGRFSLRSQLVTLFICVVGFGRGSILTSVALLVASVTVAAIARPGRARLVMLLLVGTVAGGIVRYREDLGPLIEANTKLGSGLEDLHRSSILSAYLDRMNVVTAITGGSYENTVIAIDYNDNPHNSFIRAHHVFGAAYLVMIALLPFCSASGSPGRVRQGYFVLLMGILYFRAFTEPILFPTPFDFFFFSMCFLTGNPGVAAATPSSAPRRRTGMLATAQSHG